MVSWVAGNMRGVRICILRKPRIDESLNEDFIRNLHSVEHLNGNVLSDGSHGSGIAATVMSEYATSGIGGSDVCQLIVPLLKRIAFSKLSLIKLCEPLTNQSSHPSSRWIEGVHRVVLVTKSNPVA